MEIKIRHDRVEELLAALPPKVYTALERCALEAEKHAKQLAPVDTGDLRDSISHKVVGDTAYIGTNIEYGAYVELGTGIHYEGGRQTPWTTQNSDGTYSMTRGQRAQPFLKPAIADYADQYREIIKDELTT
jgi:HK97 gp10 family phage protein